MKTAGLWAMAVVLAVGAGVGFATWKVQRFLSSDVIAPNVFVEDVDVSGMRPVEAAQKIREEWAVALPQTILVKWPGGSELIDRSKLGAKPDIDGAVRQAALVGRTGTLWQKLLEVFGTRREIIRIPVAMVVDRDKLERSIVDLSRTIDRRPVDAAVRVKGTEVEVVPEKPGLSVDIGASVAAAENVLKNPRAREVELTVRSTQPHILAKDLSGFDTVLAEYTTSFNAGDRNRAENLRLAASMINETVILPGDTFSLNQHLGQRTVERGFKEAGTIVDGELVPTPGGGVCQVATTIYNVVLLAGMQVTERQHHSRPIPYVPAGRDATISWGGPDLKFRNNLKHPVILLLSAQDGRLTARLLGNREDKVEVELVRSGFKTIPKVEQWLLDPTLKPGEVRVKENGRNGTQVTLSRIIKKNGRAMKTEILHTDVYKPAPKVVLVGPQAKSPSQEGTEAAGSKVWDAQTLPQVQTREGNVGSARRQGQNAPLRSGPQDR